MAKRPYARKSPRPASVELPAPASSPRHSYQPCRQPPYSIFSDHSIAGCQLLARRLHQHAPQPTPLPIFISTAGPAPSSLPPTAAPISPLCSQFPCSCPPLHPCFSSSLPIPDPRNLPRPRSRCPTSACAARFVTTLSISLDVEREWSRSRSRRRREGSAPANPHR